MTENSLFWAKVEDAIRSCRLLESGGSSNSFERENLIDFEEYAMGLIEECKVSPDIFLERSSYMKWWREYVEILAKQMMGDSHESRLVDFMRGEHYRNYATDSLETFQEGHSNVNPPDSSNAGLGSTERPQISPSSFSLRFSLCYRLLPLLFLFVSLYLLLFHLP